MPILDSISCPDRGLVSGNGIYIKPPLMIQLQSQELNHEIPSLTVMYVDIVMSRSIESSP